MAETVSIEEELARRGNCFVRTKGASMEPILHENFTTVVLEPLNGLPKKYDVVMYHRPDGVYVLHRVLKVGVDQCLFRGDNCVAAEIVPNQWLVGVMTGYYNGEAYTSCGDRAYLRYLYTLVPRYGYRWCRTLLGRTFLGRVKRKLFG